MGTSRTRGTAISVLGPADSERGATCYYVLRLSCDCAVNVAGTMLRSAFQHMKPCGMRAKAPFCGSSTISVPAQRSTRVAATRPSAPSSWDDAARGVSGLVKALNSEIRSCKTLDSLQDHYNANVAHYNEASVSAMWVTLANLRYGGDMGARLAFARKPLLAKTLATVHLMEMRTLANVLWAMGKLRFDLNEEENGPYLAGVIEERVAELVDRGGFAGGRHADQLWYGLATSGYPWSKELLQLLVDRTVPELMTWDPKAQCQVLLQMSVLSHHLINDEQRRQLATAIEETVAGWSLDEQQTYRSAPPFVEGIYKLGLRVSPACIQKLHTVEVNTPPIIQKDLSVKIMANSLLKLRGLGCSISQTEASRWEHMLLTVWRTEQKGTEEKLPRFSLLLNSLLAVPTFAPSEELQQELAELVASHPDSVSKGTACQIVQATEAWGVALPPDLVQLLKERAAGFRKHGASGGRGAGASGRPGGTAGGRGSRDGSGIGRGRGRGDTRPARREA